MYRSVINNNYFPPFICEKARALEERKKNPNLYFHIDIIFYLFVYVQVGEERKGVHSNIMRTQLEEARTPKSSQRKKKEGSLHLDP